MTSDRRITGDRLVWEQVTDAEVGGRSRRSAFPLEINFIKGNSICKLSKNSMFNDCLLYRNLYIS